MPASSPRTPSYRLHKPSGQAVVTLNGHDVYLGAHGTTPSKQAYDRVIAEWLANGRRQSSKNNTTIAELLVRYLDHVDGYYTSNEPQNIKLALKPLRQLYGPTAAAEFGPLALKAVRKVYQKAGLSRGEINKRTRRVVRLFKWAASEQLLDVSIHQALKTLEGLKRGRGGVRESEPVKPVADALVDAVRPHVSRQVWAMIEIQRHTGMRPGEVCQMRTCDINTQGRIWEYRPADHKTAHHGKDRVIFIGPRAQAVLKPWLRTELAAYLFQPCEAEAERRAELRSNRKTPVQPSQQNRKKARPRKQPSERYDTDSYRRAIAYACGLAFPHPTISSVKKKERTPDQVAELTTWQKAHRFHPHQLRHSAATRLRREFGLDVARAVLGHTSPVITEIYAELDQAKAAEAMERVG